MRAPLVVIIKDCFLFEISTGWPTCWHAVFLLNIAWGLCPLAPFVYSASSVSTVGVFHKPCTDLCMCAQIRDLKGELDILHVVVQSPDPCAGRAIVVLTFSAEIGIYQKKSFKWDNLYWNQESASNFNLNDISFELDTLTQRHLRSAARYCIQLFVILLEHCLPKQDMAE